MTHTVVGIFDDRSEGQTAMRELVDAGFIQENIDLSNRAAGDGTDAQASSTGTDANAGIGDRISNFFGSLFDDESTAQSYSNAAEDADAILTVQVDSDERARVAQEILDRNGAIDVEERGSSYGGQNLGGGQNLTGGTANTGTATDRDADSNTTINVIEENLRVGKRDVESGGARIRSRIVERPVEETIRLREEHVVVNRRPVDREVTDADMRNFQSGDVEITERSEVAVVGKEARVVEEIEVGKTVSERDETVRDTVRSTDVDVEEINTDADVSRTKKRGA